MAEPGLYRVSIMDRRSGEMLRHGVAVVADGDIEAADALQKEYPRQRYRWFDRENEGREITLYDSEERRVG